MTKDLLSKEDISSESKCLENETCWSTVQKMARSINALNSLANQPEYFGNYLGYHVSRLFNLHSTYIQPDEQELAFFKEFMNMAFELSGGKLQNVSLLDLPAFGSTLDSFDASNINNLKSNDHELPWPYQLNNALLMNSNNNTRSEEFNIFEYDDLKNQWKIYMNDFKATNYPPDVLNNTGFNFTSHIKKDMSTFLLAYATSFPNLSRNTTVWREIAKRLYNETNSENDVRKYGKYDKLIIDCAFQQSLMSHKFDAFEGCTDLFPVLTNNGLCYSFNGIETSKLWSQTLSDSEILQTFSKVFGTAKEQTRNFSGFGDSEGNKSTFYSKSNL